MVFSVPSVPTLLVRRVVGAYAVFFSTCLYIISLTRAQRLFIGHLAKLVAFGHRRKVRSLPWSRRFHFPSCTSVSMVETDSNFFLLTRRRVRRKLTDRFRRIIKLRSI